MARKVILDAQAKRKRDGVNPLLKKKFSETTEERDRCRALYDLWIHDCAAFVEDVMPEQLIVSSPKFHRDIYNALYSNLRSLIIAPRGHGKSMVCSVFYPIHETLFNVRRNVHIISASEGVAIEFLRKIKAELETNQYLQQMFGKQKSTKWSETHIILNNGASIMARGAEMQSRGPRPDLIILDDIETEESVESKDRIEKLKTWLFKACLNSLTPLGQCVWVGTVINHLCVLWDTFQNNNSWCKLKFQAYVDGIEDANHVLWPELWSHARLQEKKLEIGSTFFASEYQNDPVDNASLPIKRDMIRTWETLPEEYNLYIGVDPAYSEDIKADYKTCVLVALDNRGNRYLVQYIHTHDPQGEFNNSIINLWQLNRRRIVGVAIPNSGTEKSFFKQFIDETLRRGVSIPVREIKNYVVDAEGRTRRKKVSRQTATLQHLFEQGRYYIHSSHTDARYELENIGISKHDDLVDALMHVEQIIDPFLLTVDYEMPEHSANSFQQNRFSLTGTTGYGI